MFPFEILTTISSQLSTFLCIVSTQLCGDRCDMVQLGNHIIGQLQAGAGNILS
jgi:hypothetical protein